MAEERDYWIRKSTGSGLSMEESYMVSCQRDAMISALNDIMNPDQLILNLEDTDSSDYLNSVLSEST